MVNETADKNNPKINSIFSFVDYEQKTFVGSLPDILPSLS